MNANFNANVCRGFQTPYVSQPQSTPSESQSKSKNTNYFCQLYSILLVITLGPSASQHSIFQKYADFVLVLQSREGRLLFFVRFGSSAVKYFDRRWSLQIPIMPSYWRDRRHSDPLSEHSFSSIKYARCATLRFPWWTRREILTRRLSIQEIEK